MICERVRASARTLFAWMRLGLICVTTKVEAVRVERFQRFGRVDLFGILPLRQAQGQNDSKNKGKRWTKLKVYE